MKLNHYFILILLFFSQNSISQVREICKDTIDVTYQNNQIGTYIGCLNYEGKKEGYGTLKSPDGFIYKGDFKNNKKEGQGKLTYPDGYIYNGGFKNNKKEGQGKLSYPSGTGSYIGEFQNNMFNGIGVENVIDEKYRKKSKGKFQNDILFEGEKTIYFPSGKTQIYLISEGRSVSINQFKDGNLEFSEKGEFFPNNSLKAGTQKQFVDNYIITTIFKNGIEVSRTTNIDNYYDPSDIIGASESISLDLIFDKNDKTKYINIYFDNSKDKPYRFIFDTGAEMMSIGFRMFNELKGNGLVYEDLGITISTIGIRGEPTENKVIKITQLKIGDYTLKNVVALVKTLETANNSLIGIQFLEKFSDVYWSLKQNKLIFYK